MEIETPGASVTKRDQGEKSSGKNTKRARSTSRGIAPIPTASWLGFVALEKLSIERGAPIAPTCIISGSVVDKVKDGLAQVEAKEIHLVEEIAFPHVPQYLISKKRLDDKEGQHYNLTQLPMDEETNAQTGLCTNHHVAVFFQRSTPNYKHSKIFTKTKQRLKDMEIPVGNGMVEPIYIPCKEKVKHGKEKFWSGTIKLHLLNPPMNAINMLRGIRPFILNLDKKSILGKVCNTWNSVARNNLLSSKVDNPLLQDITSSMLYFDVFVESFRRRHDYEITSVQKNTSETWAWLIVATPKQAKKMEKNKIPFLQEVMHVISPLTARVEATESRGPRLPRLTEMELKKKNAIMLCVYGLHKMKKIEDTISSINAIVGGENVLSYYFPGRVGKLHTGFVNMQPA